MCIMTNVHLEIIFQFVIKLLIFLKINFKGALDDGKGNLNVKIGEMCTHN